MGLLPALVFICEIDTFYSCISGACVFTDGQSVKTATDLRMCALIQTEVVMRRSFGESPFLAGWLAGLSARSDARRPVWGRSWAVGRTVPRTGRGVASAASTPTPRCYYLLPRYTFLATKLISCPFLLPPLIHVFRILFHLCIGTRSCNSSRSCIIRRLKRAGSIHPGETAPRSPATNGDLPPSPYSFGCIHTTQHLAFTSHVAQRKSTSIQHNGGKDSTANR